MTLPPGRARLVTRPLPSGSAASANTIGIVEVARLAAGLRCPRDDDVDLAVDELGHDLGRALDTSLCPAILDRHVAALGPAKLA